MKSALHGAWALLRTSIFACAALPFAFSHVPALGWGAEGHRVVALIAMQQLEPAARDQIEQLLQVNGTATIVDVQVNAEDFGNIADLATWADAFRFNHPESKPWHFVDVPITVATFDRIRDCGNQTCAVAKISEFAKVLGDHSASDADRAVALRFLVHFVGDLHQPLHSADNNDRGGNSVRVVFAGQSTNLHHLWDTELVLAIGGQDQNALANRLVGTITDADRANWAMGAVEDWTNEAHKAAVDVSYGNLPASLSQDLSGSYRATAMPVVETQLKKAGVRLATLLNANLK